MYINGINNNYPNFTSKKAVFAQRKIGETVNELAERLIEVEKKKIDADKNILRALLKGFSIGEISEKMGVSLYKVNEISTKYNAHKIYIQRRNDIILDKLRNGVPRKTIMKEMDVSKRTVQIVAEANNAFAEKVKDRDALIVEKIKSGKDGIEVAKEMGISEATVMRAVQKFGLTIRDLKKSNKA